MLTKGEKLLVRVSRKILDIAENTICNNPGLDSERMSELIKRYRTEREFQRQMELKELEP